MTPDERIHWIRIVEINQDVPAIVAADEEIKRLREAVRELVNERQPLGIDRPAYQKALAALAKEEGE
jgi:hypothetical protein